MYPSFFGLKQEPFSIAPDPRYLFMSERHREALAHLLYGLRGGGGFVLLTGEIGAGKTTVARCFLEQIPKRCNYAYIFNPKLTALELLKTVCDEFRVVPARAPSLGAPTVKDYVDALNAFLLRTHATGQNNVLVIDEAQNLSADVLEQLRLLTNLETNERKLLQIILIGQPELRTMLARPELEQLAQRVIARYHLDALTENETAQYLRHRLAVAGLSGPMPFDRDARRRIHALARGIPRRINLLADRALLGAYASGKTRVHREIVDKAAREVFDSPDPRTPLAWLQRRHGALAASAAAGAALASVVVWALIGGSTPRGAGTTVRAGVASAGTAAPAPAPPSAPSVASAPPVAASAAAPSVSASAWTAADAKLATAQPPPRTRDEGDAWRELAKAWNLTLGDGEPCRQAQQQQIHCFRVDGANLASLRRLGRPGIVTLYDGGDGAAYALLTGLGPQTATLSVGGIVQTMPLASLERIWRGEFATFWRAPPGYAAAAIGDAASGPIAAWLDARLAKATGTAAAADAPLKARVQAFQSAQGLKPDGLAGPVTLMQLNRATGVDEPRLRAER